MSSRYDRIGVGYAQRRRTDPRWMSRIVDALGSARSVVNVGAGTASYEPPSVRLAVEPSLEMIRQRPPGAAPVVRAVAERLPVRHVDATLAVLTVHHWTDWRAGLAELRRVSDRQVVLAYDTAVHAEFWLVREYLPEVAALEATRPSAPAIADELGADTVTTLPLPWDFTNPARLSAIEAVVALRRTVRISGGLWLGAVTVPLRSRWPGGPENPG